MSKFGKHPRILEPTRESRSPGFIYRLVSSQRFLAIIGLVFLLAVVFPLLKTYNQRRLVEQEIADIQNQIQEFENQNQQLSELLAYLQSDQSLEDQARLNLNLKKPGEAVIVIENKDKAVRELSAAAAAAEGGKLAKWWRYFFN